MKYFVLGKLSPPLELTSADKRQAYILILLPLVGNTSLGAALLMSPLTAIYFLGDLSFALSQWISFWLGLSLCVNALPTFEDAQMLLAIPEAQEAATWAHAIIFLESSRHYWADFIYAILVGISVPVVSIWILNGLATHR
jgi:hypothetical protein